MAAARLGTLGARRSAASRWRLDELDPARRQGSRQDACRGGMGKDHRARGRADADCPDRRNAGRCEGGHGRGRVRIAFGAYGPRAAEFRTVEKTNHMEEWLNCAASSEPSQELSACWPCSCPRPAAINDMAKIPDAGRSNRHDDDAAVCGSPTKTYRAARGRT